MTPEYVYRMWGEKFSMADIENGLTELRSYGCTESGDWRLGHVVEKTEGRIVQFKSLDVKVQIYGIKLSTTYR